MKTVITTGSEPRRLITALSSELSSAVGANPTERKASSNSAAKRRRLASPSEADADDDEEDDDDGVVVADDITLLSGVLGASVEALDRDATARGRVAMVFQVNDK